MAKIGKCGQKLKLLPLLTESVISFEIFSKHLWLLKSKNSYLCHLIKLMTSSGSFKRTSKRIMSVRAFGQCFRPFLEIALQKLENILESYL